MNLRELKNENMSVKVMFDNGGGINVKYGNYKHYYNDGAQAGIDYYTYLQDGETDSWDGNDEDIEIDEYCGIDRNGGYKVVDEDDIADMVEECMEESDINDWQGWGGNEEEFIITLAKTIKAVGDRELLTYTTERGKYILILKDGTEVEL